MARIKALQSMVTAGGHIYPVYIGFLSAADLVKIAEAPAFTAATTHEQIATNILTPPIKDWQRPIDGDRVQKIADVYSNGPDFMPNPVLLSENALLSAVGYTITPVLVHQQATGMVEIEIPVPAAGASKPLWILDGQHRINGLARSTQAANPIPLVLLLNNQGQHFAPSLLAKIFAQVTTEARKLDDLHDAWLTYAFDLDIYHNDQARRDAMTTVAHLCKLPNIVNGDPPNPFMNRIQFNPRSATTSPPPGGFRYNCIELANLLHRHYYNAASPVGQHLPPHDLARHLVLSHQALTQVVQAPQDRTVFLSDNGDYGQKIMQDAWFIGVLTRLLRHGPPVAWIDLLRHLNFQSTDWNFSQWVRALGGKESGRSKDVAAKVFQEMFASGNPPASSTNLANYLQGDAAQLELAVAPVGPNNQPLRRGRTSQGLPAAGIRSQHVGQNIFVRLRAATSNIASIVVHDGTVRQGVPNEYAAQLRRGVLLDENVITRPWNLVVTSTHYGGVTNQLTLTINW